MGTSVTFDYPTWSARYPEFSNVTSPQAQAYFNEATLYCANNGSGPVNDTTVLLTLLNMLTAHIAYLAVGTAANPASGLVGRISNASEGSVSVGTDLPTLPGTAAWFVQSQYGLAYWQATARFRTAQYRAPRPRYFGPGGYGGVGRW